MIEGSAAVGIAALGDDRLEGKRVSAIVTGRNVTLDLFTQIVSNERG
jgi:threonine dehydratase